MEKWRRLSSSPQLQNAGQSRRSLRCRRAKPGHRLRHRHAVRDAAPDDGTARLGPIPGRHQDSAPASGHRDFRRGVPGNPSVPGWQRPPVPRPHDIAPVAGRLRLRPLQFAGNRHRAEQGQLLSGIAGGLREPSAPPIPIGAHGWHSSCEPYSRKNATCNESSIASIAFSATSPNCPSKYWNLPDSTVE